MTRCALCSGPLALLGELGNLRHYRCRHCGADWTRPVGRRTIRCRHCGGRIDRARIARDSRGAVVCRYCADAERHALAD